MEGVGPITIGQVREFLGHCNVTVKPVVDLAGGMPVDCYEIPARMHEIVKLRSPFEVFPNHGTHHLGRHISLAEQHFAALLAA